MARSHHEQSLAQVQKDMDVVRQEIEDVSRRLNALQQHLDVLVVVASYHQQALDGAPDATDNGEPNDADEERRPLSGKDMANVPRDEAVDRVMANAGKPLRASEIAFRMINRGFKESDNLRNAIFMLLRRRPEKYRPIKNGTSTLWEWITDGGEEAESENGE